MEDSAVPPEGSPPSVKGRPTASLAPTSVVVPPDSLPPASPSVPASPSAVAASATADPSPVAAPPADLLGRIVGGWTRFWFAPQSAVSLGLVRILFGLVTFGWTLSLLPDLLTFFGRRGVQPAPPNAPHSWSLLVLWQSDRAVWIVWGLLLAATVALTVGWHSRVASLLVFICLTSFERRNQFIFNAGDGLLRIEAFLLVLAPSGAALSLDRRRTAGSFWSFQQRAPWVLRLMQIQMTMVYLSTVQDKLVGTTWTGGTATSYSLRLYDLRNFATPAWITTSPVLMNLATWGTLALEVMLGVLVWRRSMRPWILGAGVIMHLTILLTLMVGFFTFAVYVLYVAFLPPETSERFVNRVRSRLPARLAGEGGRTPDSPASSVQAEDQLSEESAEQGAEPAPGPTTEPEPEPATVSIPDGGTERYPDSTEEPADVRRTNG